MSRLSAIVVTRNHREVVGVCLGSLLASDRPPDEIVVIDHASDDGTAALVRRAVPSAAVLDFPDNPGFGEGVNRALRVVTGDAVVLLNPDASVAPETLGILLRRLEDDGLAAVVPKVLVAEPADDAPHIHSAGLRVDRLGRARDRGCLEPDRGQLDRPETVLAGSGAALLLRTAAVREVSGFDPSYFLYYEDLDLCWRLWLAGYEITYEPSAVARHALPADPDSAYLRHFLDPRNRFRTLLKNLSMATLARRLPRLVLFEVTNTLDLALRHRRIRAVAWRLAAWAWTWRHLPSTWRARRTVQGLRRRSDGDLDRLFVP